MRFVLAALVTAVLSISAATAGRAAPLLDFGAPPSGEVPLLFNDHHVYAKPDKVRTGRLLAAIVRGGNIYVTLRSMFEQMGARVAYDGATRTARFVKAGVADVSVTVGRPEIVLDGHARPLDVPPIIERGSVLVPVRVIVESLGGYVAYNPELRTVAVRYAPAGSIPVPAATPVPLSLNAPEPLASKRPLGRATVPAGPPVPVGTPQPETYLVADVSIAPRVYDAISPGNIGATGKSFAIRSASEFGLIDLNLELGVAFNEYAFPHDAGRVSPIGGGPAAAVPAFVARDRSLAFDLGVQLSPEKYYLELGYATLANSYGDPRVGGLGIGLEKLPVLERRLSYDASLFYYPNVSGARLAYAYYSYRAGLTASFGQAFLDVGYAGDYGRKKVGAPVNFRHSGAYAGLGARF